jgi:hypothetical protein
MSKSKHRKDHDKALAKFKSNLKPESVPNPYNRKKDHLLQGTAEVSPHGTIIQMVEVPPKNSRVSIVSTLGDPSQTKAFVDGMEVEVENFRPTTPNHAELSILEHREDRVP